jgi:hypothetical protein
MVRLVFPAERRSAAAWAGIRSPSVFSSCLRPLRTVGDGHHSVAAAGRSLVRSSDDGAIAAWTRPIAKLPPGESVRVADADAAAACMRLRMPTGSSRSIRRLRSRPRVGRSRMAAWAALTGSHVPVLLTPGLTDAHVGVTFFSGRTSGTSALLDRGDVAAHRRRHGFCSPGAAAQRCRFWMTIESDAPIIAERAMYDAASGVFGSGTHVIGTPLR